MSGILRYDYAVAAVAEARTCDEVRDWENKIAAAHEYARRIRDRSMEIDLAEIKARCRRRRGEILRELRLTGQFKSGADEKVIDCGLLPRVTLEELEMSKNESAEAQRIADIDGGSYERLIARCRTHMQENPEKHVIDVLHVKDGPINGARALMGSRHEPDDSLDYFPTPPWATRALMQHVMPAVGLIGKRFESVWEPACGEGHIAEVLREYSDSVYATDIHDYGYNDSVADFLRPEISCDVDWIITNPPFGDKAEAFVLRAIDMANVGVAMFFRLQWIPTAGRYNRIFGPKPPTLVAFFSERVPLVKGRWDPLASTATDYVWLVWVKGKKPLPPLWIPPGQREALSEPDDIGRFTARPVKHRVSLTEQTPLHDPVTGEIRDSGVVA